MKVYINSNKLYVRQIGTSNTYMLTKDFRVVADGDRITVPAGFETDFASIPKLFRFIIPMRGKHGSAAVVHDYLYLRGVKTRKKADEIFLALMKYLKVTKWKRRIMYRAVRLFGWYAWKKGRKI